MAWSGGAGSDDHGQPRIAVSDGSRESQPSGLELLPALPPQDFVLGGLTIAPQLAGGEGALGCWPALREVFPAIRQPRCRVHQPADVFSKLPLLCVPTRWALWSRLSPPTRCVSGHPKPATGAPRENGCLTRPPTSPNPPLFKPIRWLVLGRHRVAGFGVPADKSANLHSNDGPPDDRLAPLPPQRMPRTKTPLPSPRRSGTRRGAYRRAGRRTG